MWKWKRGPVVLATVLVAAEVVSLSGPAGAAPPASPLEILGMAAPMAFTTAETLKQPKFQDLVAKLPKAAFAEPETPAGPEVPESGPVEDSYFADAVFLGDSRTEGFYLYSGLKTGVCLYAVGATAESVFTKDAWETDSGKIPLMDALSGVECGKVYLMLGVNELGWPRTEDFHDQYAKVIDRVREEHPDAQVILQSILPVSAKQDAKGSYVCNSRITVFNEVVRTLAEEKDCAYVNVAEAVTGEDGCLEADLNFDGIHLNPAGCKRWLEYLRTHSV